MNLTSVATNALESELGLNLNTRRGLTYICEKNMNPSWIGRASCSTYPRGRWRRERVQGTSDRSCGQQ